MFFTQLKLYDFRPYDPGNDPSQQIYPRCCQLVNMPPYIHHHCCEQFLCRLFDLYCPENNAVKDTSKLLIDPFISLPAFCQDRFDQVFFIVCSSQNGLFRALNVPLKSHYNTMGEGMWMLSGDKGGLRCSGIVGELLDVVGDWFRIYT